MIRRFVKYKNRKIHEIGSSRDYVTSLDLKNIILEGHKIEIHSDQGNEDVTTVALSNVLRDCLKRDPQFLSVDKLREMILWGSLRQKTRKKLSDETT